MVPVPRSYQHEEYLSERDAGLDLPNELDFEIESSQDIVNIDGN